MSGHSKWAQIKRKKGATDAKRGTLFTKLARSITVAAKSGPDPDANFQLRMAIEQAKAANLPKDNIERAIAKASGAGKDQLEQVIYEAFGPGGVAILIDVLTDNKNRSASEIKHILSAHGGSMAGPGSVRWMFDLRGVTRVPKPAQRRDELELKLIDAGVEDIEEEDGNLVIYSAPEKVKNIIKALGEIKPEYSGLEWIAKERTEVKDKTIQEKLEKLYDALDQAEDVNDYSTNQV
ncbi:YebC/PmpR family DNA-binding transcriptional regulator [Patescibacteria group bacterium]|nr:YebC/PmpR family DNA-binding transcriptional regulator [Patescibacteria group bacterium]